jgi:CheY-like chemotaxis protein
MSPVRDEMTMGAVAMRPGLGCRWVTPISRTGASDVDTGRIRLAASTAGPGAGRDDEPDPTSLGESKPYEIDEPTGWGHGLLPEVVRDEPDTVDSQAGTAIPLRLLLVDDSPLFLGTLQRLLETIASVHVIGAATSGRDALDLVDRLRPDVVLTDLVMPEIDGLELTRRLAARPERPTILVMSHHDLPAYRTATREAGADAFVTKADLINQLEPLVRHLIDRSRSGGPDA